MLSPLAYPPVGRWLKARRDVLGYSLPEASDQLQMSEHTLLLLETERFPELPEPAFAKGYLRRYASHLKLNPADVIAMFDDWMQIHRAQNGVTDTPSVTAATLPPPALPSRSRVANALDAVLTSQAGQVTAAAICLGVFSYFLSQGAGMASAPSAPMPREQVAAETWPQPSVAQRPEAPVAKPAAPAPRATTPATATVSPGHWLIASETTHVHVTDHRGLIVFSGLVKHGQPVRLSGIQPFDIQSAKEGTVSLVNDKQLRSDRQILANR